MNGEKRKIERPPVEEFNQAGRLNLRDLIGVTDEELELKEAENPERLRSAYYWVLEKSLRRVLFSLEKMGVNVFIDEESRLVFKDSNPHLEKAAEELLSHYLQANKRLDIEEARKSVELEDAANRDSLTGVWNKPGLEAAFRSEREKAKRKDDYQGMGILFFDIDNFKSFNDAHGQSEGDKLIKTLAERVRTAVRTTDVVCRHGGEEFVVLLNDIKKDDAYNVAALIHDKTRLKSPTGRDITTSLGVTFLNNVDLVDQEALARGINQANEAEAYAKKTGKDRVAFFDELPEFSGDVLPYELFKQDYIRKNGLEREWSDRRLEIENSATPVIRQKFVEAFEQEQKEVEIRMERAYRLYLCRAYEEVQKLLDSRQGEAVEISVLEAKRQILEMKIFGQKLKKF